jgi:hypothetical protein
MVPFSLMGEPSQRRTAVLAASDAIAGQRQTDSATAVVVNSVVGADTAG